MRTSNWYDVDDEGAAFTLPSSQSCRSSKTTEHPAAVTTMNSAATTILDDQSSSLMTMPIASAPAFPSPMVVEQSPLIQTSSLPVNGNQFDSPVSKAAFSTSINADFDHFIGQQLQATLEKRLRSHSVRSTKSIRQRNCAKTGPTTFTRSETEKLIAQLNLTDSACNLDYYEEQVGRCSPSIRLQAILWPCSTPLCPPRLDIALTLVSASTGHVRSQARQLQPLLHDLLQSLARSALRFQSQIRDLSVACHYPAA